MRPLVLAVLLAGCGRHAPTPGATMDLAGHASSIDGATGDLGADLASKSNSTYDASAAVAYANAHWNDGQGLCAQFTSACLQAGGLSVDTTWVPTLFLDLASYPYEEYSAASPTAVGGVPGDVVFYSNATGSNFCIQSDPNTYNCGHVGLVVTAGADGNTATADFHDSAHYQLALIGILGGTTDDPNANAYSAYRVYHLGN